MARRDANHALYIIISKSTMSIVYVFCTTVASYFASQSSNLEAAARAYIYILYDRPPPGPPPGQGPSRSESETLRTIWSLEMMRPHLGTYTRARAALGGLGACV